MATPMRLANKTIATLEDVMALAKQGQAELRQALRRAQAQQDLIQMRHLSELALVLTAIERKAMANRNGDYAE